MGNYNAYRVSAREFKRRKKNNSFELLIILQSNDEAFITPPSIQIHAKYNKSLEYAGSVYTLY